MRRYSKDTPINIDKTVRAPPADTKKVLLDMCDGEKECLAGAILGTSTRPTLNMLLIRHLLLLRILLILLLLLLLLFHSTDVVFRRTARLCEV
jgi:hypothetical protein